MSSSATAAPRGALGKGCKLGSSGVCSYGVWWSDFPWVPLLSPELFPKPGAEPVQLGAQRHPRLAALAVPPSGTEVLCGAKLDGEVCCQGEPVLHPEEPR